MPKSTDGHQLQSAAQHTTLCKPSLPAEEAQGSRVQGNAPQTLSCCLCRRLSKEHREASLVFSVHLQSAHSSGKNDYSESDSVRLSRSFASQCSLQLGRSCVQLILFLKLRRLLRQNPVYMSMISLSAQFLSTKPARYLNTFPVTFKNA